MDGRHPGGGRARPGRPGRLGARRRRRRLHAGRRHLLAGPLARPRLQQRRSPSRWSPPTACVRRVDETTSPTCSGPCVAAAAASASSPRWSSGCSRSPRCTPACCSSRWTGPPRCSRPGASGSAPCPTRVTSIGRVLRFPPLPELPPFLSGRSCVVVEAACQLSAAEADELLAPLRALGPAIDTFATIPVTGARAAAHGPARAGARQGRRRAARRAAPRGDRVVRARGRARRRLPAAVGRAAPPRRRAAPRSDAGRRGVRLRRRVRPLRRRRHPDPASRSRRSRAPSRRCSTPWVRGRRRGATSTSPSGRRAARRCTARRYAAAAGGEGGVRRRAT